MKTHTHMSINIEERFFVLRKSSRVAEQPHKKTGYQSMYGISMWPVPGTMFVQLLSLNRKPLPNWRGVKQKVARF